MNQQIRDFLKGKRLMALATSDQEYPWSCNVYFVVDDDLHFYFLSSPKTIHIQQIEKNQKVSLTIADSDQTPDMKKKALQVTGTAKKVTNLLKVIWFIKRFTETPQKYNPEEIIKSIGRVVYEIAPTKMKYFNQELFADTDGYKWVELEK